jgi:hypothetical protein
MVKKIQYLALLCLCIVVLIAGCAQAAPAATATAVVLPTQTCTPTLVVTATDAATATSAATSTPSNTPWPLLTNVKFSNATPLSNGDMTITIKIPGINSNYQLLLNDTLYQCSFDAKKYPNLLLCTGPKLPQGEKVQAVLRPEGSDQSVFNSPVEIPTYYIPTALPNASSCANRGQNATGEIECRIAPDGNPCVVATYFDVCGYWYSTNTCPDGMPLLGHMCSDEQRQQLGLPPVN